MQASLRTTPLERLERPSYASFERSFLKPSRPVLITGVVSGWSATQRWSLAHVGAMLGARTVEPVVLQHGQFRIDPAAGVQVEAMDFAAYARHLEAADSPGYYLRLPLEGEVERLFADYTVPEYCRRRIFLKKNLWVGAPGVCSDLHFDMTHNLVAQVRGRRRVLLFAPEETPCLYPFPRQTLNAHHSQVQLDAPDLERFPEFAHARAIETELGPGELLFIPQGYWHRFETLEQAIAVNFFWLTLGLAPAMAVSRLAWTAFGVRT